MRSRLFVWLMSLCGLAATPTLVAHHSVSGVFDYDREFTITGLITEVEWINPHVYVHLDVTDENGDVTTWRLETAPTAFLRKAGITSEMLQGDGPVTVNGILSHTVENLGWVFRITYEDGHFYQISSDRR